MFNTFLIHLQYLFVYVQYVQYIFSIWFLKNIIFPFFHKLLKSLRGSGAQRRRPTLSLKLFKHKKIIKLRSRSRSRRSRHSVTVTVPKVMAASVAMSVSGDGCIVSVSVRLQCEGPARECDARPNERIAVLRTENMCRIFDSNTKRLKIIISKTKKY